MSENGRKPSTLCFTLAGIAFTGDYFIAIQWPSDSRTVAAAHSAMRLGIIFLFIAGWSMLVLGLIRATRQTNAGHTPRLDQHNTVSMGAVKRAYAEGYVDCLSNPQNPQIAQVIPLVRNDGFRSRSS